jgi:hypothetical protein
MVCPLDQAVIVDVVRVGGIDTGQPEPPRHRPEVDVEDEPLRRQPLRPAHGAHLDDIPTSGAVSGRGRPSVDNQAAHLGQRHPERLHHVAKR